MPVGLVTPNTAPQHCKLVVKFRPEDYLSMAEAAQELDIPMAQLVRQLVRRHCLQPVRIRRLPDDVTRMVEEAFGA